MDPKHLFVNYQDDKPETVTSVDGPTIKITPHTLSTEFFKIIGGNPCFRSSDCPLTPETSLGHLNIMMSGALYQTSGLIHDNRSLLTAFQEWLQELGAKKLSDLTYEDYTSLPFSGPDGASFHILPVPFSVLSGKHHMSFKGEDILVPFPCQTSGRPPDGRPTLVFQSTPSPQEMVFQKLIGRFKDAAKGLLDISNHLDSTDSVAAYIEIGEHPNVTNQLETHRPFCELMKELNNPDSNLFTLVDTKGKHSQLHSFVVVDESSGWGKSQLAFTLMGAGLLVCYIPTSFGQMVYRPFNALYNVFERAATSRGGAGMELCCRRLRELCDMAVSYYLNHCKGVKWAHFWANFCSSCGNPESDQMNPIFKFLIEDADTELNSLVELHSSNRRHYITVLDEANVTELLRCLRTTFRANVFSALIMCGTAMSFINLIGKTLPRSCSRGKDVFLWSKTVLRLPLQMEAIPLLSHQSAHTIAMSAHASALRVPQSRSRLINLLKRSRPFFTTMRYGMPNIDALLTWKGGEEDHTPSQEDHDLLGALLSMAASWNDQKGISSHHPRNSPAYLLQLSHSSFTAEMEDQTQTKPKRNKILSSCVNNGIMCLSAPKFLVPCSEEILDVANGMTSWYSCDDRLIATTPALLSAHKRSGTTPGGISTHQLLPTMPSNCVISRLLAPLLVPRLVNDADVNSPCNLSRFLGDVAANTERSSLLRAVSDKSQQTMSQALFTVASFTRCSDAVSEHVPWIYTPDMLPDFEPGFTTPTLSTTEFFRAICFHLDVELTEECINKLTLVLPLFNIPRLVDVFQEKIDKYDLQDYFSWIAAEGMFTSGSRSDVVSKFFTSESKYRSEIVALTDAIIRLLEQAEESHRKLAFFVHNQPDLNVTEAVTQELTTMWNEDHRFQWTVLSIDNYGVTILTNPQKPVFTSLADSSIKVDSLRLEKPLEPRCMVLLDISRMCPFINPAE